MGTVNVRCEALFTGVWGIRSKEKISQLNSQKLPVKMMITKIEQTEDGHTGVRFELDVENFQPDCSMESDAGGKAYATLIWWLQINNIPHIPIDWVVDEVVPLDVTTMQLEDMMYDYGLWVGNIVKDRRAGDWEELRPAHYVEQFLEMAFSPPRPTVEAFLRQFYEDDEVEHTLSDLNFD